MITLAVGDLFTIPFITKYISAHVLLSRKFKIFPRVLWEQVTKYVAERFICQKTKRPEALPMYKVCETVRANHGPDGAVVLDIQRGRVLRLNITGSFIFGRLQQGDPESTIIDGIIQRFCVSHEIAQADVNEFLNSMEQEGLIRPAPLTVRQ